jgi:3-phenylpropionate/trans-cinnamate dioxygenase ferredoxin component
MSSSVVDGGWVRVAAASDIGEDSTLSVRVEDQPVCLVRSLGQLHALVDECTHGQVPLSDGDVDGGTIECWLHGSRFDLATGRPLTPPATQPVRTFPVCVADGDVYVSRASRSAAEVTT